MALDTPFYDLAQFSNVYEPSEDTFMFLDALELETNAIADSVPKFIVEIGSGSGILITSLASVIKNKAFFFTTDINYEACRASMHTAKLNGINVESCCMDLLCSFRNEIFDLIIFNPPYVVTESIEMKGTGLSRAWAGGVNGREIIDRFLLQLPYLLSKSGMCYLLLIEENKPEEVERILWEIGLKTTVVLKRKVPGEHLLVLKICR